MQIFVTKPRHLDKLTRNIFDYMQDCVKHIAHVPCANKVCIGKIDKIYDIFVCDYEEHPEVWRPVFAVSCPCEKCNTKMAYYIKINIQLRYNTAKDRVEIKTVRPEMEFIEQEIELPEQYYKQYFKARDIIGRQSQAVDDVIKKAVASVIWKGN